MRRRCGRGAAAGTSRPSGHAHCWPEYWSLLGGPLEPGEWSAETVQRELLEEAGLRIGDHPQVVERMWDRQGTTPQLITVFAVRMAIVPRSWCWARARQLRFVAPPDLDAYRMLPYLRAVVGRWLATKDGAGRRREPAGGPMSSGGRDAMPSALTAWVRSEVGSIGQITDVSWDYEASRVWRVDTAAGAAVYVKIATGPRRYTREVAACVRWSLTSLGHSFGARRFPRWPTPESPWTIS